jgi:hypothetical protein
VFKPLSEEAIFDSKRMASEYGTAHVIDDMKKYEEAIMGMDMKLEDEEKGEGKPGLYSLLKFEYNSGNPSDYSRYNVPIKKDAIIYELEKFPGIYRYQQYCINNPTVIGAIHQMNNLCRSGRDYYSHFTALSSFTSLIQVFNDNWH